MEAAAHAKFVRFAPRKVNQVLKLIRAQSVEKAFGVLAFTPKATATLIAKTLKSAVANCGKLKNPEGVWVKECWVGQGPALKRMRPGPMGRGMPFKRKTCHLTIVVSDRGMPVQKKKKKNKTAVAADTTPKQG